MNTGQSRKHSIIEALTNIGVGMVLAFVSQIIIIDWIYGIPVSLGLNLQMTVWFTLVSLVRSYILRRMFNNLTIQL